MPVTILVRSPECNSDQIIKRGQQKDEQRYGCRNPNCTRVIFKLHYKSKACVPGVKQQIIEMAVNGSGIRDTARVLKISANTVINEIKKKEKTSVE